MPNRAIKIFVFAGIYVLMSAKFCQPAADPVLPEGDYCDPSFVLTDSSTGTLENNLAVRIGQSGLDQFIPISEGDSSELIAGGQGATMIIYDLEVSVSTPTQTLCVGIRKSEPGRFGFGRGLVLNRSGDAFRGGPIYHPLSFASPSMLAGESFDIELEVTTADARGEISLSVVGVDQE